MFGLVANTQALSGLGVNAYANFLFPAAGTVYRGASPPRLRKTCTLSDTLSFSHYNLASGGPFVGFIKTFSHYRPLETGDTLSDTLSFLR